jgi:hypothetical protein
VETIGRALSAVTARDAGAFRVNVATIRRINRCSMCSFCLPDGPAQPAFTSLVAQLSEEFQYST